MVGIVTEFAVWKWPRDDQMIGTLISDTALNCPCCCSMADNCVVESFEVRCPALARQRDALEEVGESASINSIIIRCRQLSSLLPLTPPWRTTTTPSSYWLRGFSMRTANRRVKAKTQHEQASDAPEGLAWTLGWIKETATPSNRHQLESSGGESEKRLMDLPAEIRDEIYLYCFQENPE